MQPSSRILALAGRIGFLAIFGFLAIALAGPILTLLSVVLSFALIGFLLWLPFRLLTSEGRLRWRGAMYLSKDFVKRGTTAVTGRCLTLLRAARQVSGSVRGTASAVGAFLLEACSGALVGLLLAVAFAFPSGIESESAVPAALLGATLGALVAVSRSRHAPQVPIEQ